VDAFALELAIDRALARLEAALSAHTRAWAETGVAPPPPRELIEPDTRRVLERGAGEPRVRAYLIACRLAAIEADERVARVRAMAPSWSGLIALTAARAQAVASPLRAYYEDAIGAPGRAYDAIAAPAEVPADVGDFRAAIGLPAIDVERVARVGELVARAHAVDLRGLRGLRVDVGGEARTFVIDPGRDVRVRVRGGDSVARWMEALHELGHALVGLRPGPRPPRAHDEGAAAWIARAMERADEVERLLGVAPAIAARAAAAARAGRLRQVAQRAHLAAYEAALLDGEAPPPPVPGRVLAVPPPALWLDPGAQLAYAAADAIADTPVRV